MDNKLKSSGLSVVFKTTAGSLLLLFVLSSLLFAEQDTVALRHHQLKIDPVSILTGGLYGYYEFRIDRHHAAAVDGGYTYPLAGVEAWLFGANYRYYYNRRAFVGLFVNRGYTHMVLPSTERGDTAKYTLEISLLNAGANWGKTWYLWKRFPLTIRAGVGYPLIGDLAWKDGVRHPWADFYDPLYRFTSFLDSELSFGVAF